MTTHPRPLKAAARLALAATLFWIVGCQTGGAPAVASTSTAPEAQQQAESAKIAEANKSTTATPLTPPAAKKAAATDLKKPAASATKDAPAAAGKDKKTNFKIAASAPAMNVGAKGAASISVSALNGYKWNKEYPAKLIFKDEPKNVKLGKNEFKQMSGDFKIGDKKTDIPVSMKATTVGKETVTGVLKFSICNETACIIEKADVKLAVNVQK